MVPSTDVLECWVAGPGVGRPFKVVLDDVFEAGFDEHGLDCVEVDEGVVHAGGCLAQKLHRALEGVLFLESAVVGGREGEVLDFQVTPGGEVPSGVSWARC